MNADLLHYVLRGGGELLLLLLLLLLFPLSGLHITQQQVHSIRLVDSVG